MSYLALARKWRPRTFDQMVGQEHVRRALVNALDSGRVHHAFLFTGTRGVGKTTVARILAKALNCEQGVSSTPCGTCGACEEIDSGRFVDLIEVDAASRTKVDDTRELLDNAQYAPAGGRFKVYLIDEVHMLSTSSFNALLKTLEEPPPHVKFLLATTDPQKVPATVLSRCLQFNLKRLPTQQIAERLEQIAREEGIDSEPRAIELLARSADGSMRDALSLLDQGAAFGDGALREADVRAMLGSIDRDQVVALLKTIAAGDGAGAMDVVARLDEFVPDYANVLDEVATLLQRIALVQVVPTAADETRMDPEQVAELAADMTAEDVQLFYQIAVIGRRDLPLAPDPRSGFEMTLLRMLAFRPTDVAARPSKGPGRVERGSKASQRRPKESAQAASWPDLIDKMAVGGAPRQLASNCVLERREGDAFFLRLDEHSSHLLTRQLQDKLRENMEQYFGRRIRLNIAAGTTPVETPAKRSARETEHRLQAARESIENDPNVRALQETFDATIQPDSVQPTDRGQ